MFSAATKKVLLTASTQADQYGHNQVLTEHLLVGLLGDPTIKSIITNLGSSCDNILQSLDEYLSAPATHKLANKKNTTADTLSDQVEKILIDTRALSGDAEIAPLKLLLVLILNAENCPAVEILKENGVSMTDIKRKTTHIRPGGSNVKKFCTNLTAASVNENTAKIVARDSEIKDIIKTLLRQNKSSALLIGKSGVGKTAIIEGLANFMVIGAVPSQFKNVNIYALNNAALIASAQSYGEIEASMQAILKELQTDPNAILVVDDLHSLHPDVAMNLRLVIADGSVRCIATTTPEGYRNTIQKAASLDRLFLKKTINEPTEKQTQAIAEENIERFELHHKVKYQKDAIETAIRLATHYIPDQCMPGKVLDILDQAGANKVAAKFTSPEAGPFKIKVSDIEKVIANMTGIPISQLSQTETDKINRLEDDLNKVVMGQEQAAKVLAKAIRRSRAGLNDPTKPIGSFLFQGPTGVGKTELTQQLSKTLGMKLLRYDMSEYMEKHSVSRLIGAPPGYLGSDQAAMLIDPVVQNPNCIILLDEIEKAHPAIYNILLQVMDHGTLTGSDGKKADFRNAIIVATTNAGSSIASGPAIGFSQDVDDSTLRITEAIKRQFTPEFRNRLDAIVPFMHLNKDVAHKIADKFLGQLAERLKLKNIEVQWDEAAKNWLVDKGYNREFGARPMARLIQDSVANTLADEILGGRLEKGGSVRIEFNGAASGTPLNFVIEEKAAKKARAASNQNIPQPPQIGMSGS
jgi:ATP-dependent Clp protease ATP-binding subunit ClpA